MFKPTGERGPNGKYDITYGEHKFSFPSVTTILAVLQDDYLKSLKEEIGEDELKIISQRAANRGSVMHLYLENFARALKVEKDIEKSLFYTQHKTATDVKNKFTEEEIAKGLDFFYNIFNSNFTNEFIEPVLIEGLMVSIKNKYAGRTDIIYKDNEKNLVLGDYKSSSAIILPGSFKEVKYKLQLSAYINAFEELYNKQIAYGVIWVGHPQGCQKIKLSKDELLIYFHYFKNLISLYNAKEN